MNDHHCFGRFARRCVEHVQVGNGNFGAFAVAWAKTERVFQAALDDLVGYAYIHHVRQVVFGGSLGCGQANRRGKRTHHRRHTGFVHLFNLGRASLRCGLRITQQRLKFGTTHGFDAGFINVFNGHHRPFAALLARIGQGAGDRMQDTDLDGFGLRASYQWESER